MNSHKDCPGCVFVRYVRNKRTGKRIYPKPPRTAIRFCPHKKQK